MRPLPGLKESGEDGRLRYVDEVTGPIVDAGSYSAGGKEQGKRGIGRSDNGNVSTERRLMVSGGHVQLENPTDDRIEHVRLM